MGKFGFFSFNVYMDAKYRLKFNNGIKSSSDYTNEHRLYYYCYSGRLYSV
jgi:hypothetical protein